MQVNISVHVKKRLINLPKYIRYRIEEKIDFFSQQNNPLLFAKHIGGKIYRFRVGDYRILFEIKDQTVCVIKIDRRDKVYK